MNNNNILCLTSNLPRWQGDSTTPFVLNLARELQALGWQVDDLTANRKMREEIKFSLKRRTCKKGNCSE